MTHSHDRVRPDASNRGPLVNVINWILLVVMCLSALLKVLSKWILVRKFQYDDAFTVLSMLFATACGVAITFQVSAGLGRHKSTLSQDGLMQYQKAAYTSQLMYTLSLGFAKQTVLQLFALLLRDNERIRRVYAVSITNAISTIVLLLCVAFQCSTSTLWAIHSTRCFDQAALWKAFAVIDILMIVAITVLAHFIVYALHMPLKVKIKILISFCSGVGLIPLIVLRLVYVLDKHGSSDPTYDDFSPTILMLVYVYSTVVFASIPFLKPVLRGIPSGLMVADIRSIAPVGNERFLFSTAESTRSRNHYGMRRFKERGDSQERIIMRTKEVHIEVSAPRSIHEGLSGR
ncbi:hypothetical protein P280DRAFT_541944 [Massarina eburnea CBS 473.64]|uniref:Rhodopsin domain-containing protein n=1 Tax=Massarina eburnea CBS 473.64 TaxID=1395130 RepID=A0A6A6S3T8_9PLEO|nr:hypothetical protein P280DRAFT_541944 [Massarina eburnea CBS 473.64]